eukprot:CAMPEP_0195512216 /NCGR_PEP_ID=MMETSP0794_2-20130614/4247_1 /TAXON_ID=515487 /ORGANISM="Stephanopyxis turris, Strain CCMP 815" /LENGTH=309 /DNA_ID=CAMNT_0040639945 /DNA_START=49 /DNA_END=978 /DNA_ORIENTATION=+
MGNCKSSMNDKNYTDFFRGDDEQVPIIEKMIPNRKELPESFDDLKEFAEGELQTGDILICHCTHTFGKLAQVGTRSTWDHVSMVVRLDDNNLEETIKARTELIKNKSPLDPKFNGNDVPENCPAMKFSMPGEAGPVEVFEAMGSGVHSYPIVEHAIARGPALKYVAVRKLRNSKGEPLDQEARAKCEKFVQEFWGRKYETHYTELARAILKPKPKGLEKSDKSQEGLDAVFCSELVAEVYQRMELLPEDTLNSNDVLPGMFAPDHGVDKLLEKGSHDFKLGEAHIFRAPQTSLSKRINNKRAELWAVAT